MVRMEKEGWEKFWEYLLNRAWDTDTWWLKDWLEQEKEWYKPDENEVEM